MTIRVQIGETDMATSLLKQIMAGLGGREALYAEMEVLLSDLPHGFAQSHRGRERDVEAPASAFHWNEKPGVGGGADMVRHARRFTAEEQDVAILEGEFRVGQGGAGREQDKPAVLAAPPLLEAVEINVAGKGRHFEIVHAGAPEIAVGEIESGRLDDVDRDAEAGGHAQDRAGVAGDVGLVQRDAKAAGQIHASNYELPLCHTRIDLRQNHTTRVEPAGEWSYRARRVNSNQWRGQWNS